MRLIQLQFNNLKFRMISYLMNIRLNLYTQLSIFLNKFQLSKTLLKLLMS